MHIDGIITHSSITQEVLREYLDDTREIVNKPLIQLK